MWCQHSSSLEQHESKNVMVNCIFSVETGSEQYNTFPYDSLQPNYFTKTPQHSFLQAVLISSTYIFQYPAVLNDSYHSIHICLNVVSLIISLGAKMAADACFFRKLLEKMILTVERSKVATELVQKSMPSFFILIQNS